MQTGGLSSLLADPVQMITQCFCFDDILSFCDQVVDKTISPDRRALKGLTLGALFLFRWGVQLPHQPVNIPHTYDTSRHLDLRAQSGTSNYTTNEVQVLVMPTKLGAPLPIPGQYL